MASRVCPRSGLRFTRVMVEAPARASSTAMARAAPPAPRITARTPAGDRIVARDWRNPLPSVFSPISSPPRLIAQFTAPMISAAGFRRSSSGITATLWGIVQLKPCQFMARAPRTASPRCSGRTSTVRYRQSRPIAASAGSTMAWVGFSATGNPKTPTSSCLKLVREAMAFTHGRRGAIEPEPCAPAERDSTTRSAAETRAASLFSRGRALRNALDPGRVLPDVDPERSEPDRIGGDAVVPDVAVLSLDGPRPLSLRMQVAIDAHHRPGVLDRGDGGTRPAIGVEGRVVPE